MNAEDETPNRFVRFLGAPARATRHLARARRPAAIACWIILGVLVLWDAYLFFDGKEDNTWSEVIRDASDDFPILPWFFGALVSHLFHQRDNLKTVIDADAAATLMTVFSVTLIGFGVFGLDWPLPRGVTALLGVAAGYALWPKVRTQPWNW